MQSVELGEMMPSIRSLGMQKFSRLGGRLGVLLAAEDEPTLNLFPRGVRVGARSLGESDVCAQKIVGPLCLASEEGSDLVCILRFDIVYGDDGIEN